MKNLLLPGHDVFVLLVATVTALQMTIFPAKPDFGPCLRVLVIMGSRPSVLRNYFYGNIWGFQDTGHRQCTEGLGAQRAKTSPGPTAGFLSRRLQGYRGSHVIALDVLLRLWD